MATEKRLIDANALKQNIESRLKNGMIIGWLCSIVDDAKSVDAVEVVRCKDCKHWEENDSIFCTAHKECRCGYWKGLFDYCKPLDFCSYGERKDND